MFKSARHLAAILFVFPLIIAFFNPADAADGIIFEKFFTIGEWHLHASHQSFNADNSARGSLKISKNNLQEKIQHGFLVLNGAFVFLRDFLDGDELVFETDIALKAANGLIVFLVGDPGASITIQITGIEAPTAPPQITFFTAEPTTIKQGNSVTLAWQTVNAVSCVIEPDMGAVELSGSVSVVPKVTTSYKLIAVGAGDSVTSTVTVTIENSAPTAEPRMITTDEDTAVEITLAAGDVDGDHLNYAVTAQPGMGTLSGTPPALTYTPNANYNGSDSFSYKANDGQADSNTATVSIEINPVNDPPVAQAGSDGEVSVGDMVALDGSGSVDVDEDPLIFSWELTATPQGSAAALSDASIVNPTFVPDVPGAYVIELIVSDGELSSGSDTVAITANPRMVVVPDVVALAQPVAEEAIRAARLSVGSVNFEHSETIVQDHVIRQSPVAGTSAVENSAVDLSVSLGSENQPPTVSFTAAPASITKGGAATLSWTSLRADSVHIDNGIGKVSLEGDVEVLPEHTTTYTITVTGPTGSANAHATVEVAGSPEPQPEGSYGERYEDLVPPDATVDKYDPKRFSLITGVVQDINQSSLPGVTITIHGHAQYGSVTTDDRGRFSIPVEGGGTLRVVYQKQGLIPVQRKVYVPWNDNAIAETVIMITEDPAATTLTFDGNVETVVTHKSKDILDESGTRRAMTMVFSGDNRAYLIDEQGNDVQQLTTITTRATEYPTPESMPAKLPPTSAFTYCAELSVDGAQRVRFDKPVVIYVDNFLGFPVGSIVPVGYYDRDKGVWVPSENGVVVKLLDFDGNGVVDALDADGNDQPDDLNGDGFYADEVKGLNDEQRYLPGTTYWRAVIKHFTPCDLNWPIGAPPGAISPNASGVAVVDQQDSAKTGKKSLNDIGCFASFVEQRSRIFHEDIPIPGTNMSLHYTSSRTSGYKPGVITVPASGDAVPGNLLRIIVQVNVAGKNFEVELPPAPNQIAEFEWDGLDYLGRAMSGTVVAYIKIGFVYNGVYYVPSSSGPAFGQPGQDAFIIPSRQEFTLWQYARVPIARSAGVVAEGWTLSEHHQLSPLNPGILFKGDGTTSTNNVRVIDTIAGNGIAGFSGDGGPATDAQISYVTALETDAAGNLYICDYINDRIRKVDSDGMISSMPSWVNPYDVAIDSAGNFYVVDHLNSEVRKRNTDGSWIRFAGTGGAGYSGDGGPASVAHLYQPMAVALDASGNLYIVDTYNHRIRKVDTAGIITTVAGNGTRGHSGDGGPATRAQITYPNDIVIDAAGILFIAEGSYIRRVDTSGIITTVAGDGGWTHFDDGIPATQASLDTISGLAIDASGNLYLAQYLNDHRVRKIDTMGIITTIAGDMGGGYSGDGGPAVDALLDRPNDVAVDAAGNIYISDWNNYRIRKISVPSPRLSGIMHESDFVFTEENGTGFIMSAAGLHKKTIDLNSGVSLFEFVYDEEDNLLYISDQFGNTTSIERNAGGLPTAIISPEGIRTELIIDSNNHITRITYADGSFYDFEYTSDGLMLAENEPAENRFEHDFDNKGRLKEVLDKEGGHWTYARTIDENSEIHNEVLSAEGNLTSFLDYTDSTGKYTSTISDPSGALTRFVQSGDGLIENHFLPCGTDLEFIYDIDSQYKYKYVKQTTESTPAGLEELTTIDKTYTDTNDDDMADLMVEMVTVNGKVTSFQHNILAAQKTVVSPEGRMLTSLYDPATLQVESVSVQGLHPTAYGYDARGRLTSVSTNTRHSSFNYNSNGFLESVTDSEDHTTTYQYDPTGRVTGIGRSDGGYVEFIYDKNGNMTVLTNPVEVNHKFKFNRVNLNSFYSPPLSGSYSYIYNKDRQLVQTNFPSGKQIFNIYDKTILSQIQTPEGNVDFTYFCGTKIESIAKGVETIAYGYDGKLITSETISGTLNQSLDYTYNNNFDVSSFAYAGRTENYSYDKDGLLTAAGGFSITRNAGNGLPEAVVGGALNLARTFNGYGEVDTQSHIVSGQNVSSWALTRDNNGRIVSKTETIGDVIANYAYTYDSMGRLLTVTRDGNLVESYNYDLSGTRISETNAIRGINGRTFSYSDEDHLLTAGSVTYAYDPDGFLTTKTDGADVTAYSYSLRGELLKVALSDGTVVEYVHDPLGRRIAKKVDGVIMEKYLWQGMTRLLAVYDGADNLLMRFEYADDRTPVAMTTEGDIYYLGYDQVGSLRVVADYSANMVKRIDYDSFGNIIVDTNEAFKIPFGFAGGLYDRDAGLVRFGFRDYNPEVGRWTAKDPIFFAGGDTDLYGYVLNDPVNLYDSYGLIKWGVVGKGALAAFGGGVAIVGGALASSTGLGAIGGVPAVLIGSAGIGWGISQMIVGFVDNEIPFMGTKEAIIKSTTEPGLLQDELLGINALGDMLMTKRTAPTDIGKINDALQSGYSIYESSYKIVKSMSEKNSGSSLCP